MLRYLLMVVAVFIGWRGVTKLDLKARHAPGGAWGALLVWAALLVGTVVVWMLYPPRTP